MDAFFWGVSSLAHDLKMSPREIPCLNPSFHSHVTVALKATLSHSLL